MASWDPHSVRDFSQPVHVGDVQPILVQQSETAATVRRSSRVPEFTQDGNKLFCLMLTLLILCASGVLVAVLVAGVVWASQTA